ncbi:hypothetical protein U3653_12370 [Nocardia sp. CDC186]|uniref:Secreted protein n=1 Tax=Nocardia implantans TaxID=3108168 RepID=A0ABU6ATK8_9NOCA|nr:MULTISPECIES: hypothetical protein [unclassified Nocardia]MBF6191151.1 hypothetical protein [Nocardia beijingensis]MEA3529150.1 hypothetical protein [Nocardia sp. CDC192]MEB3510815.1 hypothetical protein [Nocardia sp. CDC186]
MKPISTATTFFVPLFFVLGVATAPPVGADTPAAKPAPGACTGSACLPSLSHLLRRAPLHFRQSGLGGDEQRETPSAPGSDLCAPLAPRCGA